MMAIAVQENQGFQHGLGALYELTAVGNTQKLVMVGSVSLYLKMDTGKSLKSNEYAYKRTVAQSALALALAL